MSLDDLIRYLESEPDDEDQADDVLIEDDQAAFFGFFGDNNEWIAIFSDVEQWYPINQENSYRDMLLSFKLLEIDQEGYLYSWHQPEFRLPKRRVLGFKCEHGHDIAEDCYCGVTSTYNIKEIQEFQNCQMDDEDPRIPIVGVFQVLGPAYVDRDIKTIRSKGVYLWAVVKPQKLDQSIYDDLMDYTQSYYRQVAYHKLSHAWFDVKATLQRYLGEEL